MRIRLDRLGDEPFTWQETLKVDPADLDRPELLELGEIALTGRIRRIESGYWLEAEMTFEQILECMRCLVPVTVPTTVEVTSLVAIEGNGPPDGDAGRELDAEAVGVLSLREPVLDTETLLAEQLQLNIPMKPLCREDCAGLCATCGANQNDGACACEAAVDPRWAALAALQGEAGRKAGD